MRPRECASRARSTHPRATRCRACRRVGHRATGRPTRTPPRAHEALRWPPCRRRSFHRGRAGPQPPGGCACPPRGPRDLRWPRACPWGAAPLGSAARVVHEATGLFDGRPWHEFADGGRCYVAQSIQTTCLIKAVHRVSHWLGARATDILCAAPYVALQTEEMPSLPLRPRSASELVDAAFQILRAHYPQFIMCSAIGYAPYVIAELVFLSDPARLAAITPVASILYGLGIALVYALMSAVLVVCASQAYLGDPVDVGAAVRKALPRLHLVILGGIIRYVGIFFGVFTFFVLSLYLMARWFAVTPVIVLERRELGAAFSRSAALSSGRKWHILRTILLVFVIYLMLAIGVQFAASLFRNLIAQGIISALFTILVYPVVAITEALLYFDTRIKA